MKLAFKNAREALIYLRGRRSAYISAFMSPAGQQVLRSLGEFCFANASTFCVDSREHARMEGRREVWLHIQSHLRLNDDQLFTIASGGYTPPATTEDDP